MATRTARKPPNPKRAQKTQKPRKVHGIVTKKKGGKNSRKYNVESPYKSVTKTCSCSRTRVVPKTCSGRGKSRTCRVGTRR